MNIPLYAVKWFYGEEAVKETMLNKKKYEIEIEEGVKIVIEKKEKKVEISVIEEKKEAFVVNYMLKKKEGRVEIPLIIPMDSH